MATKRVSKKNKPKRVKVKGSSPVRIPAPIYDKALEIRVGPVATNNKGFSWNKLPDLAYSQYDARIPDDRISQMSALQRGYKNPTKLRCNVMNAVSRKTTKLVLHNVFVLAGRPVNDIYHHFAVVSCMYWYKYFTFTGRFNKRRATNDLEALDAQGQHTFRKDNYLEYSVHPDGRPYTALEMLHRIIKTTEARYGVSWFAGHAPETRIKDNGFIPDDREYIRIPLMQLVGDIARMAHVGIRNDDDGKIRLYSLSRDDTLKGMDESAPIKQDDRSYVDMATERASALNVGFTVNAEMWLKTPEVEEATDKTVANQGLKSTDVYPYIFNVMPVPTNLSAEAVTNAWPVLESDDKALMGRFADSWKKNGVVRGTWLPIRVAIKIRRKQDDIDGATDTFAIPLVNIDGNLGDILANKSQLNPALKHGLDEPIYTRGWFNNLFNLMYGMSKTAAVEYMHPQRMLWVSAIKQHLFQTYRINPKYLDNIVAWFPKRAGLIDPVYRVQMPSPVYTQYYAAPTMLPPVGKVTKQDIRGQNFDDTGGLPTGLGKMLGRTPSLGKFTNPKVKAIVGGDGDVAVSPFTLRPVDKDLGIFKLEQMHDVLGEVAKIEPNRCNNINTVDITIGGAWLDAEMFLYPGKKVHVIITVVPASPNDDDQLYQATVKPELVGQPKGVAPVMNIVSTKEVCRIRVDGEIMNKELLGDIAQAEAGVYYEKVSDRINGTVRYSGFATGAKLTGFQQGISYLVHSTGVETIQDFTENPESAPFYTRISYETRKLVFGALWDRS